MRKFPCGIKIISLFSRLLACGALQFSPPFITTEEQVAEFAEAVAASVAAFA